MNIQEYSKKFVTILIALKSSITLWGQKNDICTSKKLEKNYGIQPNHRLWKTTPNNTNIEKIINLPMYYSYMFQPVRAFINIRIRI